MSFFRMIQKSSKPVRLFVGGLHGEESEVTIHALRKITPNIVEDGKVIIYNGDKSRYISTLCEEYYQTPIGKYLIHLILKYKPRIYVEAHCYNPKNYKKLVDPERRWKYGVPPLIELEDGILIGSVSPHIRTKYFKKKDVCITLEMPCSCEQLSKYVKILKYIVTSKNRKDLENKMYKEYPKQVEIAREYAREFFGNYPPF